MELLQSASSSSIKGTAISPNLSGRPRLNPDSPQLPHRRHKRRIKLPWIVRKSHHRRLRRRAREQNLVRREQPFAVHQIPVIRVVEGVRGGRIEADDHAGVHIPGAGLLQLRRVRRIQRRIRREEAIGEAVAVRGADGVGAGESDHVGLGEAVFGEDGCQSVEIEIGGW